MLRPLRKPTISHLTIAGRPCWTALLFVIGCGGDAGASLEDERRAAYAAFNETTEVCAAGDYAAAEPKLSAALSQGVLNPNVFCEATAKRAVCWGAQGKHAEALAELETLGPAASNQAEIFAARAFILKKQGKVAEANAALAKVRKFDRAVKEFK